MGHSDKLQLMSHIMKHFDSIEVFLHYFIYSKTSLERTFTVRKGECPLETVVFMFCGYKRYIPSLI